MPKVLIIGSGGVGRVVAHKCAQVPEVFTEIMLASRNISKCNTVRDEIMEKSGRTILTAKVDADNVQELVSLMKEFKPDLAINVALPYQDLSIMDACLEAGVNYLDTANTSLRNPPTLNTVGNGHTRISSRKRELPQYWVADSTRESQISSHHTHRRISSTAYQQ